MRYVALLRGINVVTKNVPMAKLRISLERLGFTRVTTILASGNAVFDSAGSAVSVQKKVEAMLKKDFKLDIDVIVRSMGEIEKLITRDPFKGRKVTKDTRQNVTFLGENVQKKEGTLGERVAIVGATGQEVCWSVELSPKFKTPDVMARLEKMYGKNITTRTWNTVHKIAALR